MNQQFAKDFLHSKVVHKLLKIKFLTKYFPNHCVEDINCGIFSLWWWMCSDHIRTSMASFSLSSWSTMVCQDAPGQRRMPVSFIKRFKNDLFSKVSLKLEVLSLKGDLCFNIVDQNKCDRIWYAYLVQTYRLCNG